MRRALQDLADGEGDTDAYMALVPEAERKRPAVAAEIGWRLLGEGRVGEAIAALEAAAPKKRTRRDDLEHDLFGFGWEGSDAEWKGAYLDALDATGRGEEAQRLRWAAFEERLSIERLRAHLKALPDFENVAAKERAVEHALGFPNFPTAMHFFHAWPEPRWAARLVGERHAVVDCNPYHLLDPVPRWLEGADPLAATLMRRAMVEDKLAGAKSKCYRHAARHLAECRSLAPLIGGYEAHEAFVARLRAAHGRKTGFCAQVADAAGIGA